MPGIIKPNFVEEIPNPLLLVKLADNPSEETLKAIEKLGQTDPKTQDKIFKAWAKEIRALSKVHYEYGIDKEETEEITERLEGARSKIREVLFEMISKKLEHNLNSHLSKQTLFVKIKGSVGKEYFAQLVEDPIYIELEFSEHPKGEVEFAWIERKESILNMHRFIPENLRGYGISGYIERIIENIAKELELSKIYFCSEDDNMGLTFALNQNYICETKNDRKKVLNLLPEIFNHPEIHDRVKDLIYFVKEI